MSKTKRKREQTVDDNTFAYDNGGMSQCISGFGDNAKRLVRELSEYIAEARELNMESAEIKSRIDWHIDELVHWCRHLNGKCKELS
jgi:hypothetical protein